MPFWPGGLDEVLRPPSEVDLASSSQTLKRVPPGFSRGLKFEGDEDEAFDPIEGASQNVDGVTAEVSDSSAM